MKIRIIQNTQSVLSNVNPEEELVYMARASSGRPEEEKRDDPWKLIYYLIKNSHWSPFEHTFVTTEIITSRAIGRQLLRHRSFTFQEFSQRYAAPNRVEPISIRLQAEKNRQSSTKVVGNIWQQRNGDIVFSDTPDPNDKDHIIKKQWISKSRHLLEELLKHYEKGIELGIAKESARMLLPETMETTLYMTGNLRSWMHFISLRDDTHAQKEAQEIARDIKEKLVELFPLTFKAFEEFYGR